MFMKYVLKEMSNDELPREKLKKYGVKSLADYELLAIILKTGTNNKSVIDLSIELLEKINNLDLLSEITLEELLELKGIGEAKALTILASIEFSNRLLAGKKEDIYIKSTDDVYKYLKYELVNEKQEKLICIYINYKNKIIDKRIINIGSLSSTNVDIKSCIKWGLKLSSQGIIFVHNHPSGDAHPSAYDDFVTKKFREASNYVDIKFIDHLIIGRECYYSYSMNKIINIKDNM